MDDYWAHLVRRASDRQAVLLILCLREPDRDILPLQVVVVTYEQLMVRVRQKLGAHATDAAGQYLTFALDFVTTMDNLVRGKNRMNPEVMALFRFRKAEAVEFLHAADEVTTELRKMVLSAGDLVTASLPKQLPQHVNTWPYREAKTFADDLVHDVKFPSGSIVAIDAFVDLKEWGVIVWQRKSSCDKLPFPELAAWLQRLGVPFKGGVEPKQGVDESRVIVVTADFPFDAPLEEVAAHVTAVVTAIARAEVAPGEEPTAGAL